MNQMTDRQLPERSAYLVLLAAAPTLWLTHFIVTYAMVSIWCARIAEANGLAALRGPIVIYTAVTVGAIALIGWNGHRRRSHEGGAEPYDFDSAADRHRFLGYATLLLSALSGLATIFVGASAMFFDTCR